MTTYKHTQVAKLPLILLALVFIYSIVSGDFYSLSQTFHPLWIVFVLVFGIITTLMLTVIIDDRQVKIFYGIGLFKKHFLIKDFEKI